MIAPTDDWGGVMVDTPEAPAQSDDWGGVLVTDQKADDWGGIPVEEIAQPAPQAVAPQTESDEIRQKVQQGKMSKEAAIRSLTAIQNDKPEAGIYGKVVAPIGAGVINALDTGKQAVALAGKMIGQPFADAAGQPELTQPFNQVILDAQKRKEERTGIAVEQSGATWGNLGSGVGENLATLPAQIATGGTVGAIAKGSAVAALRAGAVMAGAQGAAASMGQRMSEGVSDGLTVNEAADKAFGPALVSGIITAAVTRGFGATGAEAVFKQGGTRALGEGLKQAFGKEGLMEAAEESVDQVGQTVLDYATGKKISVSDAAREILTAGVMGYAMGAGVNSVQAVVGSLADAKQEAEKPDLPERLNQVDNDTLAALYAQGDLSQNKDAIAAEVQRRVSEAKQAEPSALPPAVEQQVAALAESGAPLTAQQVAIDATSGELPSEAAANAAEAASIETPKGFDIGPGSDGNPATPIQSRGVPEATIPATPTGDAGSIPAPATINESPLAATVNPVASSQEQKTPTTADNLARGEATTDQLPTEAQSVLEPNQLPEFAVGAMRAGELPPQRTTSTKNRIMEVERQERGEAPILKEARESNEETFAKAEALVDKNPNAGEDLVNGINDGTINEISPEREALLLYEKVRLRNERESLAEIAADPNEDQVTRENAAKRWQEIEGKISAVDLATHRSGAQWGRLGQFRQRLLKSDYTFESMEQRARVAKGGPLTTAESTKIKEQSEKIRKLEAALEAATARANETAAGKAADEAVKDLKNKAKKEKPSLTLPAQRDAIKASIAARVAENKPLADLRDLVQKLALNFVRGGINSRDPLVDSVHSELAKIVPGITPRQTRDLISGYGDFKALDTEPAKVTLRGLKGELQQIGKIEDMQSKIAPKKTGMERRETTAEERRLIKEVNELKKKGGFTVTDPATQLKTAMEAIKTRLRNEIEDLDNAIASRVPIANKKGGIEHDAEAAALKETRDAKKAQYAEMFPKAPLTEAELITKASKSLDRSISDLEADLKLGKLYADKGMPTPKSAELDAKRARLEALRAERDMLRDLDTATVEAKREAALEKAIEDAQKIIVPREGTPTADTQRVAELKAKLEEVRAARAESPEAKQRKIDAATKALNESIAELDRKIREEDFSTKPQAEGITSPEIENLRAERQAMETLYREMKNAAKPKLSPDELALKSYKTRSLNRIAELQERIAKGDFSTRPKRELKMDPEAKSIAFRLNEIKKQYNADRFKDALAKRSVGRKIFEGGRDALNTARAVMTSFDLSAVLRQGGFIALGNPVRAAKALPDMFRAFASEKSQLAIDSGILARPNADLYKQSGLFLHDPSNPDLSKMEEAYMSRWSEKIPGVSHSQRAYTTFLNRLRADSFDAMANTLGRSGKLTKEEAKAISNYINVATGRGNLATSSGAAISLNAAFFSPRYVVSRFELLAGQPMYGGSARTRKAIAGEYAKYLAGVAVVLALGISAGAELEDDPTSSEFGKLKFGNTRLDPLSGLSQVSVFLSRFARSAKKVATGEKFERNEGSFMGRFLRAKLSPVVATAVDIGAGSTIVGEPVTPKTAALRMVVPLSFGDIKKAMEEQGVPAGTALAILALFGMSMQTYEKKEEKPEMPSLLE